MSGPRRFVARFDVEENEGQVFDAEGVRQGDGDAVCLADMFGELVDEMGRRGFDVTSASFSIDAHKA